MDDDQFIRLEEMMDGIKDELEGITILLKASVSIQIAQIGFGFGGAHESRMANELLDALSENKGLQQLLT